MNKNIKKFLNIVLTVWGGATLGGIIRIFFDISLVEGFLLGALLTVGILYLGNDL